MAVPDDLHVPSTLRFTGELSDPEYPPDWERRRLNASGHLLWKGRLLGIGSPLARELVGLRPVGLDEFEVYFGPVLLGVFDERRPVLRLIRPTRRGRRLSAE
jgi:hypothetical protein